MTRKRPAADRPALDDEPEPSPWIDAAMLLVLLVAIGALLEFVTG